MTVHLLLVGNDSKRVRDRFEECSGSRVKTAAVQNAGAKNLAVWIEKANQVAQRELEGRVDAVLMVINLAEIDDDFLRLEVFSMTEALKTNRERVFACFVNGTLNSAIECTRGCWEMQSALLFFGDRFVCADNPASALKTLLKRRPRGSRIQLNVLASADFIKGATERRDARMVLFCEARRDQAAFVAMETRFRMKMEAMAANAAAACPASPASL